MDDPYQSGHDSGYGYADRDATMDDSSCYDSFASRAHVNQTTPFSTMCPRPASAHSQASAQYPQYSPGQHQARAAQLTPSTGGAYSNHSELMSRGASHGSYRSSASSGQQYGGSLHFGPHNPLPNMWPSNGHDMQRSRSAYSDASTLPSQQMSPLIDISQSYRLYPSPFNPETVDVPVAGFSNTTQHMEGDFFPNNITGVRLLDFGNGNFGSDAGQSSFLTTPMPHSRPRAKSDGHTMQHHFPCTRISPLEDNSVAYSAVSSDSTTSYQSSPTKQPKQRRRPHRPSSDSESEVITGHVLASGRFKCSQPECDELRFGRQADFRRHYTNVHAKEKREYFCTVEGCGRSKRPLKKSKGRSFGARKDKMEEHVQTVHLKESKKRKKSPETDADEQDDYDNDEKLRGKTSRQL